MGRMVDMEMDFVLPSNIEQDGETEVLAPPCSKAGAGNLFPSVIPSHGSPGL